MRIFDEIDELVKSAKSAKSSNDLPIMVNQLAGLAGFQALLDQFNFDEEDRHIWNQDFKEDPETTIYCLKLMKKAVELGREPNHGWLVNL
jgi:hypothetical protein